MKVPTKIKKEIEAAIKLKARAKALEQEGKILTKEAKNTLIPIMTAYELKTCELGGVGVVSLRINKGSSINATKLREALLVHGLSIKVINQIVTSSSTLWKTDYIEFKEA